MTETEGVRLTMLTSTLRISRSGYYRCLKSINPEKDLADYELIKGIFDERRGRIGIRQIKMLLERRLGINMNHKKIARIKAKYNLETKIRKRSKHRIFAKRKMEHRTCKNKLNRKFKVKRPDRVYSTDITQMNYGRGFKAYLAAFKDLYTKEIVAFNVGSRSDVTLTTEALNQILKRKRSKKLMIHSDQGFHFTHFSFRKLLKENKIKQSMSRKGNCLDNAPIESLFGHLKDHFNFENCHTIDDVKEMVTREIEYYNNERPQIGLKKMPPVEFRRHHLSA